MAQELRDEISTVEPTATATAPNVKKRSVDPAAVERLEEPDDEPQLLKPATTFDVLTHTIHLQDDPSLPAITFRSMLLGRRSASFPVPGAHCRG